MNEKEWSEKVWSKKETVGLERQWSEIKERRCSERGKRERVGQKGKKDWERGRAKEEERRKCDERG